MTDLREQAIRAIANYMHDRLYDEVAPVNMLPWLREQAESIVDMCDRAIANTKSYGKANGFIR